MSRPNLGIRDRPISFAGESLPVRLWAARLHLSPRALRDRLATGWPVEQALTTPPVRERQRTADGTFVREADR